MIALPLVLAGLFASAAADSDRVTQYELRATLDTDRQRLIVYTRMRLVLPAAARSLRVRLGDARFRPRLADQVMVDGRRVTPRILDSLDVTLPLSAARSHVVTLSTTLSLDSVARRQMGYHLLAPTSDADSWYPVALSLPDSMRRFSDFDVTVDAPNRFALVTSGALLDTTSSGDRVTRHVRAEHVQAFALAFGENYRIQTVVTPAITVRAMSAVSDTAAFRLAADDAAKAASWYAATYGFFPVKAIAIVPGSLRSRGGFPYANVFMIHRGDLSPPFLRWITAHELAHYYWGLHVLASAERLDWLMLALGIWTDQLYLATSSNRSIAAQWRDAQADNSIQAYAQAALADHDLRLGLPESVADSLEYDYNSLVRHGKGAVGVYLAAGLIGSDRFVALQRELLREYRYRPLSVEEFARRMAAAGAAATPDLLRRWARGDARIEYAVRDVARSPGNRFAYTIRIESTGTVAYPVRVRVRSASGRAVDRDISGANEDTLRVSLDTTLAAVDIDPDGAIPSWSSANADMRSVFLRALGNVGTAEVFEQLATQHLAAHRDPALAALLIERAFERGNFADVVRYGTEYADAIRCVDRVSCLAALQVVRALDRSGNSPAAREAFDRVETEMVRLNLGTARRLTLTRDELRQ